MFHSARLKLTLWYVLISMLVSILFSVSIYAFLTQQLDHEYQHMYQRYEQMRELYAPDQSPPQFDLSLIKATEERIRLNLILVNLIILAVSGAAGYILAGRTLAPLEEMLEEQDRFVSDASHELRTPLTVLRSEIEVGLRDKKLSVLQARELLQSNLEEVVSLQTLSESLLKLSHIEKFAPSLTSVSLLVVTKQAVKKISSVATLKHITIKNDVTDVSVHGDEAALVELIIIFLDNAIKYSQQKTTINLTTRPRDHSIELRITDQGSGISPEDREHIFDRFYRADTARSKDAKSGYGLGLSIAKKIVMYHKGSIEVESTPGKGTAFTLRLPKA